MTTLRFAVTGRVGELTPAQRQLLLDRASSSDDLIRSRTAEIVRRVRIGGDDALRELASELDDVAIDSLEVPRARWREALDGLEPALRRALERATANIGSAHRVFLPETVEAETEPGIIVGRRPDALRRVGIYAPGGRAAYPSSVLMGAVPARVAGVEEVVLCSPPGANGLPSAVVLAAAEIADVDRIFAVGGAGAIAAMAYGTASVPRVDRVIGPGNAYVAEAKLQVSGAVSIDSPAGPSELLVIGDSSSNLPLIARELLAQAEHDPLAAVAAVMIGDDSLAAALAEEVRSCLASQPRRGIIVQAMMSRGAILSAPDLATAIGFANEYAAEHLLLAIPEPRAALMGVRNAGTVFLGESSSVSFGDYITGANHVLPTGGLARSYSGLSILDFIRWTTYQRVEPSAARLLAVDVGLLATAEGLPGHAMAARTWEGA